MKRLALLLAVCTLPALSQEGKPAEGKRPEGKLQHTKIIQLKHVDGGKVFNLLNPVAAGRMTIAGSTVLLNGSPDAVAILEDLIRQIDVAPPPPPAPPAKRSIEIQSYMVLGVNEASDTKVPAELAGVIRQLKETFPFAGYKLLETMLVRTREDQGGETSGIMPAPWLPEAGPKAMYTCRFQSAAIEETGGVRRITLRNLRFGGRIPFANAKDSFQFVDLGTNLDTVSVREGQKAVIGKTGLGPGKESLFLVIAAKVVD